MGIWACFVVNIHQLGCPSRTKCWSPDFCFAPKLNLDPNNFKFFFQNFSEVRRLKKNIFELFRPRVNFGGKQKVGLRNFVPEGHPNISIMGYFLILRFPSLLNQCWLCLLMIKYEYLLTSEMI